jgi:hypothetical protein
MVGTPVDAQVILPDGVPVAAFVKRTNIVVELTEPPLWVNVTLEAKPLPEVVETSKPVGAVTNILFVKPIPETVKLCSVDGEPVHAENAFNVPVELMLAAATLNVKLLLVLIQPVVLFLTLATKL